MLEQVCAGKECCLCNGIAASWLKIDKKGIGSVYMPVCINHQCGTVDWRDMNTLLSLMNIKGKIVPFSQIKYPRLLEAL